MADDLEPNIHSLIRVWAPDVKLYPQQYEKMRKLVELKGPNGETLESILQSNGTTSAEIMPPFKLLSYTPDEDEDYFIYAAPEALRLEVEGRAVARAIFDATRLNGWFNNPFSPDFMFESHLQKYSMTLMHSFNLQLQKKSTASKDGWQVLMEGKTIQGLNNPDGTPRIFGIPYLQREDGFTIRCVSEKGREERIEEYHCTGSFGSFKFDACRWDSTNEKPRTEYIVMLYDYVEAHDLKLALEHANDIESALLHYPVETSYNGVKVTSVVFRVGSVRAPRDVSAQEAEHVL